MSLLTVTQWPISYSFGSEIQLVRVKCDLNSHTVLNLQKQVKSMQVVSQLQINSHLHHIIVTNKG